MSNPLDPEMMSPAERLEEAASLLARGILRRRLRLARPQSGGPADSSAIALATADGRQPALRPSKGYSP